VLDIGSGGGIDVFLASQKDGPTGKAIGVDMTPSMLERARRTAEKNGLTNVEFRHGHADALPVDDLSVDWIISNCVINLTEDKGKVFREAYRALRDGGRLEISDMVTSGSLSAAGRQSAEQWGGCVFGALPEQEYLDLIAQAGFSEVRSQHSEQAGLVDDVRVYSAQVSARKHTSQ
jgi:ubiquinone/menaquinone biosynthesis C-methylase UbiE